MADEIIANFTLEENTPMTATFTIAPVERDHATLYNRDIADQHPISAITGLEETLESKQDTIADLDEIRAGAALGATALQPTDLSNKMDKANPTGTGTVSINRRSGTTAGSNSVTAGTNSVAKGANSVAVGNTVETYSAGAVATGSSDNAASEIVTEQEIQAAIDEENPSPADVINAWVADKFSLAAGENSVVQGTNCLALGKNSHAEGNGTLADQSSAHAEGTGSQATGKYSHAGGLETVASGQGAFAQGQRVKATGSGAIALGYNDSDFVDNNAVGDKSVTIGRNSKATALESIAIGKFLIAEGINQVVVGKYNATDNTSIFVVGNGSGSSPSNRANAFVVKADNKAYIKGDISSSDNEKVLIDKKWLYQYFPVQKDLATTAQVDNAKDAGLYRVGFSYKLDGSYTYGEMLSIPYVSTETGKHYGAQLFFATGDYDDGRENCMWFRTFNGSTWNNWIKVDMSAKQDKITNSNKLSASLVSGLAAVATSGSYSDLSNKPTIPTTTDSVTSGSTAALTSGGAYTALSNKQDNLPSQSGQSGKFLTTNGTTLSWASAGGGGVSRNIGEIVTSSVPLSDPNLHLLDGSLLTSTDYPEFVTAIANVYNTSTQTVTYNVNTVGTLTSNNGVYSGFSSSKYLKTNVSFKPGTSTWEICVGFNTTISSSVEQTIFAKYRSQEYYGLRIQVGGILQMYYAISSNSSTGLVFEGEGNTILQSNTDYLIKVSYDGSKYLAQLSTDDGQTWITDKETVSSTPMYDWTAETTLGYFVGLPQRYMRGSININKSYFKINGDYVWKGATVDVAGFTEESLWQGEVTTYGSCGKFVYDSTNNTVRLPKIDCVLEGTTDTEQRGTISQYLYSTGTNALNTAKTLYYIVVK